MILSNYQISLKQVLDCGASSRLLLNDNRLWSILLASLHAKYRLLTNNIYLTCYDTNTLNCDHINLKSNGEIEFSLNEAVKFNGHDLPQVEKKYVHSLGYLLNYLIDLNDDEGSTAISNELKSIVELMVNQADDLSLSYLFEAVYRYSCMYLSDPYQKEIKYLYEITLQVCFFWMQVNPNPFGKLSDHCPSCFFLKYNFKNVLNSSKMWLEKYRLNFFKNLHKKDILISNNINTQIVKSADKIINSSSNDSNLFTSNSQRNNYNTTLTVTDTNRSSTAINLKKFMLLIEKFKKRRKRLNNLRRSLNIHCDANSDDEINDVNEIANYLILLKNSGNGKNESISNRQQFNDDTLYQSQDNYFNNSTNSNQNNNQNLRTHKIYDIRRIPPLLKFDDTFEQGRKDTIQVAVKLITESKFEFKCSPQLSVKQIFEYIITYLDLSEQNLFGLFIFYDNQYYYVDSDERINKLALKWKRKDQSKDTLELYFKIKIYLSDITQLHHSLTLQFYYWELRRQFTNGHYNDFNDTNGISLEDASYTTSIELPTVFKLAVLAFHAEGGDINEFNYLYDNYVPEKHLTEISLFESQVLDFYKVTSQSQSIFESLMKFTSIVMTHRNFGFHSYEFPQNSLELSLSGSLNSSFLNDKRRGIGVSINGVSLAKNIFFQWSSIVKVSNEAKKIIIQLRRPESQQATKAATLKKSKSQNEKISVHVNSEKKAKSIVKLSQSLSRFHLAIKQRNLLTNNTFNSTLFEIQSDHDDQGMVGTRENFTNKSITDISKLNVNSLSKKEYDESILINSKHTDNKSFENHTNIIVEESFRVEEKPIESIFKKMSLARDKPSIEMINSSGNFDIFPIESSKVFTIEMRKNSNNELGFTISKTVNAYSCIREVINEPATSSGLKSGDIILSVNKNRTNLLSHKDVVTFLRISSDLIYLEIYRPDKPNVYTKKSLSTRRERQLDMMHTSVDESMMNRSLTKRSHLNEIKLTMKEFLNLKLILGSEKIDENDEVSFVDTSNNTKASTILYIKDIKHRQNSIDIQKNDVILMLNDKYVKTLQEFKLLINNLYKNSTNKLPNEKMITLILKRSRQVTMDETIGDDFTLKNTQNQSLLSFSSLQNQTQTNLNDSSIQVNLNASQNDSLLTTKSNEVQFFMSLYALSEEYQYFVRHSNMSQLNDNLLHDLNNFTNINKNSLLELAQLINNKISTNNQEYIEEFKLLKSFKLTDSSKVANYNEENRSKNRYRNVVPFNFNRVKLEYESSSGDYINASHVALPLNLSNDQTHLKFIISQTPLNNTIVDFLQMIWQHRVQVIVKLLTNDEVNKLRCPKYWPTSDTPLKEFSNFKLKFVEFNNYDDHMSIIKFELSNLKDNHDKKLNVYLCQYLDDILTSPTNSNSLTYYNQFNRLQTFINLINIYHQSGPLLVYCSTSLGRTGLFLCVYYNLLMFRLNFNNYFATIVDNFIFETLKLLRIQRDGLVQTKEQYKYCYYFFNHVLKSQLHTYEEIESDENQSTAS